MVLARKTIVAPATRMRIRRSIRFRFAATLKELSDFLEFFDRRAGAEQISVAVNIVDPRDRGPEFVVACPRRGKRRLFARVGAVPFVGSNLSRAVRRVLEQIILPIGFSVRDRVNLLAN